jgi:uncharacterized protein YndB with AHSA1/START domain
MMRMHAGILVQRPITSVFAYICRPDCLASWVTGVLSADGASPERQGVGATLVVERAGSVGHVHSKWEVTACEPPRTLALRSLEDCAGLEVFWTLASTSSGATLVWVEADVHAVGFFRSEPGYVAESVARQLQADLHALRRRLEGDV